GFWIKAQDRVCSPVADPYGIGVIDVDSVGLRPVARQMPVLPTIASAVVAEQISAVPTGDPQSAAAVAPDAPCALPRAPAAPRPWWCRSRYRSDRDSCRQGKQKKTYRERQVWGIFGPYGTSSAIGCRAPIPDTLRISAAEELSSRPEEFHLRALPEPCMTL